MLTRLRIKNFKSIDEIDIELGKNVVLIGPNNSGKTTALQALALWATGVKYWSSQRRADGAKKNGVAINRLEMTSIPIPETIQLWRNLSTRTGSELVYIDILVDGVTSDEEWTCGMRFYYANSESLYCRLISDSGEHLSTVPRGSLETKVGFLQPMSGLAAVEPRYEPGRINVLIGEGQTAQILRNSCYMLFDANRQDWDALVSTMQELFGVLLDPPNYQGLRGEITMSYCNHKYPKSHLDISSSGKGMQQTLLLLTYLYLNRGAVLLLDEPDAHLEVLRQRQIYTLLIESARESGSQIIAASHSEIILNEAADRDIVIAFVGKPHRIDDRGKQVYKALKEIGFDQYYQAEEQGWILYLKAQPILKYFENLPFDWNIPLAEILDQVFVHYVGNQPSKAEAHFYGLQEAKKDLVGIAIFDHLDKVISSSSHFLTTMWQRNEIESYLCSKNVLTAYASHASYHDDMYSPERRAERVAVMDEEIKKLEIASQTFGDPSPWSPELKVTDRFLDPLFANFFKRLGLPNMLRKSSYYTLVDYVPQEEIDPEVIEKLDAIVEIASRAKPRVD